MSEAFSYHAGHFVDRNAEIEQICARLELRRAQANLPRKVIAVHGQRGAGKSWFSLYLHRTVFSKYEDWLKSCLVLAGCPLPNTTLQAREFAVKTPAQDTEQDFPNAVLSLLRQLVKLYIEEEVPSTYDLSECSSWFVELLRSRSSTNQLFVLIVDSYMESPSPLQKLLEAYLLAPVAALERSLLILTGRGELPPSMNLSLSPDRYDAIHLTPFTGDSQMDPAAELIRAALNVEQAQAAAIARTVRWLGGQYPLAIRLLADFVQDYQPGSNGLPADPTRIESYCQSFRHIVDTLLALSGSNAKQRQKTREYFEALCILDGFKEAEIIQLLPVYTSAGSLSPKEARDVMSSLLETKLIAFTGGRYQIHDSVRPVLEKYLRVCEPEIWRKLQKAAVAMYTKWAEQYQVQSQRFTERAQKHRDALNQPLAVV